jgi:hypothetical protein
MRFMRLAPCLASISALLAAHPAAGFAQLQRMQVTPVIGTTADLTAQMATVTAPTLQATMPNVPGGLITVMLRNVVVEPWGGGGVRIGLMPNGNTWVQVNAAPPAGKYHVRFNYLWMPQAPAGMATSTHISVHAGQLPSDPVVASCTVTPSVLHCDALVTSPGGTFLLSASDDGGAYLFFNNVTVAPIP